MKNNTFKIGFALFFIGIIYLCVSFQRDDFSRKDEGDRIKDSEISESISLEAKNSLASNEKNFDKGKKVAIADFIDNEGGVLRVRIFDLDTKVFVKEKNITLPEMLSSGKYNTNTTASIQYDSLENMIYFKTEGSNGIDGSCINNDGTCDDRIYKVKFDTKSIPSIVYSSSEMYTWLLDATNDWLFIEGPANNDNNYVSTLKIDAHSGEVLKNNVQDEVLYGYPFTVSDGSIYRQFNSYALFRKFNKETLEYDFVTQGGIGSNDITLSPDSEKVASLFNTHDSVSDFVHFVNVSKGQNQSLFKYTFKNKIKNISSWWSGDSSNVFFVLAKDNAIVNIDDKSVFFPKGEIATARYVYLWEPLINHIFFSQDNGKVAIHDFSSGKEIELDVAVYNSVVDLSVY
jgi:hypothetical protein